MLPTIAGCATSLNILSIARNPKLTRFNGRVQTELYMLRGALFYVLVDESARYKMSDELTDKSVETISSAFLRGWLRFSGPMKFLVCDQESAMTCFECARMCGRFHITWVVAGSDPQHGSYGGKHTTTGLAEVNLKLLKSIMLRMFEDARKAGLDVSCGDLAMEASMAHNCLLTFNGATPAACVLGVQPADMWSLEHDSTENASVTGGDPFGIAQRVRFIARSATLRSVVERRLNVMNNTRPQHLDSAMTSMLRIRRCGSCRDLVCMSDRLVCEDSALWFVP